MTTLLDTIPDLGPTWLTRDKGILVDGVPIEVPSRYLTTQSTQIQAYYDRINDGVSARFLREQSPDDALAQQGSRMGILQGPDESRESYVARLQSGIDDQRLAGGAWSMLRQIRGYCSPHPVRVRIINNHGNAYTLERDGTETTYRHGPFDWDRAKWLALKKKLTRTRVDGRVAPAIPWSRYWVIIFPTTDAVPQPWQRRGSFGNGGGFGTDAATAGSTATPSDVFAIRRIVRTWRMGGSRCVSVIICWDDTAFDPSSAPSLPDGSWKWASKYDRSSPGQRVIARNVNAIYWAGTTEKAEL